ncbi:DUF6702 family protein [Woodsholea maritima]|uniref:DUF6702 family protein n=1 Tax=Woodsholea maritima TaxID=240237 RepID=UPI0012EAB391|nr:DUF6702 family protein [Woodsholea maritima]
MGHIQSMIKVLALVVLSGVLGAGAMFASASNAYAHRAHAGLTEIQYNPRTEEWELVHRLFSHDLHDAMGFNAYDDTPLYETPEGLESIRDYVDARFRLYHHSQTGMGTAYTPRFIGAERDGEFTYIYYTLGAVDPDQGVIVDNRILADFLDDQTNLTNLYKGQDVRSAMQTLGQRQPFLLRFS